MPQVRKLRDEEIRTLERKTLGQRRATEMVDMDRLDALDDLVCPRIFMSPSDLT